MNAHGRSAQRPELMGGLLWCATSLGNASEECKRTRWVSKLSAKQLGNNGRDDLDGGGRSLEAEVSEIRWASGWPFGWYLYFDPSVVTSVIELTSKKYAFIEITHRAWPA